MNTQFKKALLIISLVLFLGLAISAHLEGVCEPQILCVLALHQTLITGGSNFKRFQLALEAFFMSQTPLFAGNLFKRFSHIDDVLSLSESKIQVA